VTITITMLRPHIIGDKMKKILQKLIKGEITPEKAEKMLKTMQIMELEDFAKIDTCRENRTGTPEAIYAEGKEDHEIVKIVIESSNKGRIMVTRLESHRFENIKEDLSFLIEKGFKVDYYKKAALPSVVAGLVDMPVVGVPTSIGYGVGEGGFAALNAMLQSCAPGIAVVNIDNGFGAAVFAATIIKSKK